MIKEPSCLRPLCSKRSAPAYAYMRRTSGFIPWPRGDLVTERLLSGRTFTTDEAASFGHLIHSDALLGRGVGYPAEILVEDLAEDRLAGSGVHEQGH